MTILEELPSSIEELVLCGELDYDYVLEKFPDVAINIKDVVEAFSAAGIKSMEDFMLSHEEFVLSNRNTKQLSPTNIQKIRNIYAFSSLKEINRMCVLLGWPSMSQEEFDQLFEKEFHTHFENK